jgi:protein-L-isoaspartate(D-aspartate) O-methyltransferase
VVHAGCGTGYYTAIIAHVVGEHGRVTAIEFDQGLAARARTNLRHLPHVEVIAGDATVYDPGKVECIFINAGATHPVLYGSTASNLKAGFCSRLSAGRRGANLGKNILD